MRVTALLLTILAVDAFPLLSSLTGSQDELRVIKLGPDTYQAVSESEKVELKRSKINFIDVTNQISVQEAIENGMVEAVAPKHWWNNALYFGSKQLDSLKTEIPNYKYPTSVSHSKTIKKALKKIDTERMYDLLSKFSSFYTRYYKLDTGYESARWLERHIDEIVKPAKNVTVSQVHHDGWNQYSIIVSIPGITDSKVVVGAHQDSANLLLPNLLKAPGADDDGSGTVTTLEALRILMDYYVDGTFVPYNTLEFHFYSAEEGGLLGSIDVFSRYHANKETVIAMLQQDMTGYSAGMSELGVEQHLGLIMDYTTPSLNEFLKMIIGEYCAIPYHETECGYACSDHASALENGYPASFIIESEFKYSSHYIHSVMDTIDRIDWDHVTEHVKLTLGYAWEMASAKVKVE